MFAAWGRLVFRHPRLVLAVSGTVLFASLAVLAVGNPITGEVTVAGTEAGRAQSLLNRELPKQGATFSLIFSSPTLKTDDPLFAEDLTSSIRPLRADPRVSSVRTPFDTPGKVVRSMLSKDSHQAVAVVTTRDGVAQAVGYYPDLRNQVRPQRLAVTGTGELAFQSEVLSIVNRDLERSEAITLPFSLLLLILVFASLAAASLPVGVGILAILGGTAATFALARVTDVSAYALNIVSLIGLGVAIDYSLFIVNRFREELERGATTEAALATTLATAGRAITFSGLTVAIGLSGLLFFNGTFLASMGLAGALVVLLAIFYALTFLAAVLALLGPRVNRFRVPLPAGGWGNFWPRLAEGVMRRPLFALLPALGVILLAGSPFLHLRLAQAGMATLPSGVETRRGYETLKAQFPAQERTAIIAVVRYPSGDPLSAERVGALYDFSQQLAGLPLVSRVDGPVSFDPSLSREQYQQLYAQPPKQLPASVQRLRRATVGQHLVTIGVSTPVDASSDGARDLVRAIRALDPGAGGELLVTGVTALDLDTIDFMLSRTPAAVAYVVASTCVVLFLLLGSVVLPLKAVLMNALSITASFGAMVWIFQDGHLSGLLDFTPAPLDPTLPVLLFCIVFGLSMDYEVLLLTRIREAYLQDGDNRAAVAAGLESSGRLITGAAAIMVMVFLAFALAGVVVLKAIGLGLAIAVAVDATLVRILIVPASMRLLGRLNWWAPAPLGRLQRRLEARPSPSAR